MTEALVVSLPMYDWPEIQAETDRFWRVLNSGLTTAGYCLPDQLDRSLPEHHWRNPALALSQTCGFPLVHELSDVLCPIGTPEYDVPGFKSGYYQSPILTRRDDPRLSLPEFEGERVAVNAQNSQSGCNALRNLVYPATATPDDTPFFATQIVTGSHRESITTVLAGAAALCAVDPVSWALAQRHLPDTHALRVLCYSAAAPALPLVSSRHWMATLPDPSRWLRVVRESWTQAIDPALTASLRVRGIQDIPLAKYQRVPALNICLAARTEYSGS